VTVTIQEALRALQVEDWQQCCLQWVIV